MANPTTNFGWVMPTSASLVTNLPADFNVFGQAVDTSMQYLLGGTTGQILSKTSGTNMAFTWIANDQGDITGVTAGTGISVTSPTGPVPTVAIDTAVTVDKTTAQTLTNKTLTSPALTTPTISTATTNGDLLYGTGSGALARLGIGSTAQVLTVASGVPSWATPASGSTYVGASVSMSANQSIPNTTDTMLSWDTEQWDTNAIHAAGSPTRMTVPTGYGGKWRVSGQIITGSGSGGVEISIYVNGTRYVAGTPSFGSAQLPSSRGAMVTMNLELNLSAADYVQLECWQNSGGSLNVFTASRYQFSYIGA